jgi:hypothetical protein
MKPTKGNVEFKMKCGSAFRLNCTPSFVSGIEIAVLNGRHA